MATQTVDAAGARPVVLVLEDDLDVQRVIARGVERAGCRAVCAADGRDALRLFSELQPVLVCMDLMLPTVSGFEVCRRLRAAGAAVPVAAMSSRDLPEDVAHALESGCDVFVRKPLTPDVVARTLQQLLAVPPPARGDSTRGPHP